MSEPTGAERRIAPRVHVSLHLHLVYSDLDELVEHYAQNISEGGIFIKTDTPLPIGSKVRLQISLVHQSLTYIDAKGEVVHAIEKASRGKEKGMGIRFIEMCEESKEFLRDFVLSRIEEKPPQKKLKAPEKKAAKKKKSASRKKPTTKTTRKK